MYVITKNHDGLCMLLHETVMVCMLQHDDTMVCKSMMPLWSLNVTACESRYTQDANSYRLHGNHQRAPLIIYVQFTSDFRLGYNMIQKRYCIRPIRPKAISSC